MASMVIRVVKRNDPDQVATARGELEGGGFAVTSDEADSVGVDTKAYGGRAKTCRDAVVLIGKKR
jgi:hypothetical protein